MDLEKIGKNIKHFRNLKGMTQKELASNISKTESSIRKYEKGLVDIPNKVLSEIAEALEVTNEQLLGIDPIDVAISMLDSINTEYRKISNEIAAINKEIKEKESLGIDISELKSKQENLLEIYLDISSIKKKRTNDFELYMNEYLKSQVISNNFSSHMDKITLEPIFLFHKYIELQFKEKYPQLIYHIDAEIIELFEKTNEYVEMLLIKMQSFLSSDND